MTQISPVPQHLAIIMDGNRRWASERGLPKMMGHTQGAKNLKTIAKAAQTAGIPYLTLYALSTENLKERSADELKHLFSLFEQLVDYLDDFIKNNAQLRLIGDLSGLPEKTRVTLEKVAQETRDNQGLVLTLAVNYGGRDELVRAVRKIVDHEIPTTDITEQVITDSLDTAGLPEVDMVIRTAGNQRLSGFLTWQCIYAELYFTQTKWPAFDESELQQALSWFAEQQRNRGK